jgi:diguanylate cyclase (GGDEF)-like protein
VTPVDPLTFRQSLLNLLQADPPHEEKLLAQFETREHAGEPVYSTILYILTHLSFSEAEARRHWRRIRAHRNRLQMELARDVGLRVALLDYFVNVNKELKNPKVIEISIYERTERSAITDGLTGLYNHAYFVQTLKRELHRARRHGLKLSLAIFDLDNFKKVNDSKGHLEGDRVLMKSSALLKETLREIDTAARYGGEEFVVVLPETPRTGAFVVADRIRARIEQHFKRRRSAAAGVTISGGVASFPEDADSVEELVRRADQALYRSKAAGKNRITLAQGERRRHPRVAATHKVLLSTKSGRGHAGRAKNVSATGVLVSANRPLPVGRAVNVVIRPPSGAPLRIEGEVVRSTRARKGATHEVAVRLKAGSAKTRNLLLFPRRAAASASTAAQRARR